MSESKQSLQTKEKLMESLKALMVKKPLNKISIREIVEGADVNRQTFYYHFVDIYDLLQWMYHQETEKLLGRHENMLFWQEGLMAVFELLESEKEVHLCVLNSMSRDALRYFYEAESKQIIEKIVDTYSCEVAYDETYRNFLVDYYSIAVGGMIEAWLLGRFSMKPQELIDSFDRLLQDQLRGARLRMGTDNETENEMKEK